MMVWPEEWEGRFSTVLDVPIPVLNHNVDDKVYWVNKKRSALINVMKIKLASVYAPIFLGMVTDGYVLFYIWDWFSGYLDVPQGFTMRIQDYFFSPSVNCFKTPYYLLGTLLSRAWLDLSNANFDLYVAFEVGKGCVQLY
ncbi:hypothetical protein Tco_0994069 [Tanacetum coccineum]